MITILHTFTLDYRALHSVVQSTFKIEFVTQNQSFFFNNIGLKSEPPLWFSLFLPGHRNTVTVFALLRDLEFHLWNMTNYVMLWWSQEKDKTLPSGHASWHVLDVDEATASESWISQNSPHTVNMKSLFCTWIEPKINVRSRTTPHFSI